MAQELEAQPQYDVVMPVGPQHNALARLAIARLLKHANPRKIFVLTRSANLAEIRDLGDEGRCTLIDEDTAAPFVRLRDIESYLKRRNADPCRAGWYLQQFLKMAACTVPEIAPHYLLWDADTIMLQKMRFFDEDGKVFMTMMDEYHPPYFETYRRLMNEERSADFSFIAQHMMVRKTFMQELIERIEATSMGTDRWVWRILDAMDEASLSGSGFSEYETYGNFVNSTHRDSVTYRRRSYLRSSTRIFGTQPDEYVLHMLSLWYSYVSFESWPFERASAPKPGTDGI